MSYRVLSPTQVEEFVTLGYTRLQQAFPGKQALAAQDFLWERVAERGPSRGEPATWTEPMVHIKESYSDPVFQACGTERLADAIEDLVGRGRWAGRGKPAPWGWWPVNFALGADRPWDVPTGGWHWDGQHFRHHVDAPDQGLLLLCLFSEVRPRGGGTLVAEGSHGAVAQFLSGYPAGLELGEAIGLCGRGHPWLSELTGRGDPTPGAAYATSDRSQASAAARGAAPALAPVPAPAPAPAGGATAMPAPLPAPSASATIGPAPASPAFDTPRIRRFMATTHIDAAGNRLRVVESGGDPGDVLFCHPFLFHAASPNHLGVPRFMCNRTTPLREKMNFARPDSADHSPLETSIRRALGLGG